MKLTEEESRRQFIRSAVRLGCFASVADVLVVRASAMDDELESLQHGNSIHKLQGTVLVDGQLAQKNTPIYPNSTIQTNSNSYVVFAVGRDAHILRENGVLKLQAVSSQFDKSDMKNWLADSARLLTGKLLSVFGVRNNEKTYRLHTTTATIGIRGTGVYVEAEKDISYVCTCYGQVDIQSATDPTSREVITARHHDAPRIIYDEGRAGTRIKPAGFRNHSDEELELIESLVGRSVPFANINGYTTPRKNY